MLFLWFAVIVLVFAGYLIPALGLAALGILLETVEGTQ